MPRIWVLGFAHIVLALALCSWAPAARADDSEGTAESSDDELGVPELDPRAAGLALTVLGGSLFALHGRRKSRGRAAA